ncbi:MAG TPA: amidohydrolase/deacetylase family metallohydrolase [Thermomicrobiales bacterium]|nr:amidohydrolase/deacetylase family metallohydrolase [Thermomicrobiales bacterium]
MGDTVLRNARVIDPANNRDSIADIRISDGKIAAVDRNLPEQPGDHAIDLAGLLVTPGIIDMHAHVAHTHERSTLSLHPLVNTLSSGVTTVVDAGTTGWRDFAQFRHDVIDASTKIRVLTFVNIVGSGMGGAWEHEAPEMNPQLAADTASMHSDVTVGIKTAHYWAKQRFDANHLPWTAVDRAIEAGNRCGMPVMVDFFPELPNRPYDELILKKMRPGDIHTHVFAQQFPTVDEDGKVFPYMWEARERGVIFDLGHGAGSFWFRHAVPAIRDGFVPDSISTDLHTGNVAGVVIDMLTCINKLLNIGVPLNDVIQKSTEAPAKEINRPELGTLRVGGPADIAVLALDEGDFTFVDCERTTMSGDQRLRCEMTIYGGDIVYNPNGRGLITWEEDRELHPVPFHVRAQEF